VAKFIFVTGGVVSSLGKGIATASIAALLQAHGYRLRIKKLDPYLNVDPGTMSPSQHGEVFVTDDGTETDMDLGHYERFTDITAKKSDSVTSGQIYFDIISQERRGDYLGNTVQVIPHVTDIIKAFILREEEPVDFILCEIGGTVGDIEGLPYFETIRQLGYELGKENVLYIHLTLVPYLKSISELKTKPTQHSVKELRSIGIQPDIILCRGEMRVPYDERKKIGLFCNIKEENVIQSQDVSSIYDIPLMYHEENVDKQILKLLKLPHNADVDLSLWKSIQSNKNAINGKIRVAIVGKYHSFQEAYKSLVESFKHTELHYKCRVELLWIDSDNLDDNNVSAELSGVNGIVVPGGFGARGINGKIAAIKFARLNKIAFFGICLGMQLAVIEYARNVLDLKNANSTEFDANCQNVVDLMQNQLSGNNLHKTSSKKKIGGTMRLGAYKCKLKNGSKIRQIYDAENIEERHRHRYEFNPDFTDKFINSNLLLSGISLCQGYVESIEIKDHPWFIAVQFHPEYKSRPFAPHPLLISFVGSLIKKSKSIKCLP
jgi:CTP synthase